MMMKRLATWTSALLAGGLLLGASASANQGVLTSDAGLKPGLAVCYINGMIRHIDEMAGWEDQVKCRPGPAIPQVDYKVGTNTVLTSRFSDGIMARITGYIHLDKTGDYAFSFASNDGFRMEIDGQEIVEDPDVHSDRFSDIGTFSVSEPGWYPITIRYFERKNTSTLRFFWQPPGTDGTMPIVPAAALKHKPETS
ncbi:MAG: PA14 domain-containing protein [Pseudomonadota bacterium]